MSDKEPISHKTLLKMCGLNANRYKGQYDRGDLIQEGYLKALEALEKNPELTVASVNRVIARSMFDLVNIKSLAVYIPLNTSGQVVRRIARGQTPTDTTYKKETIELIKSIMSSKSDCVRVEDWAEYEQGLSQAHTDTVDSLVHQDSLSALREAVAGLSVDDRAIVYMYFVQGLSLRDIGDKLNVSRSTAHNKLQFILDKLKNHLTS